MKAAYKYPYIADKKMYAAVMGACKYIRETGYFNKAVEYYADKYDVDRAALEKHIRERQAAGQKNRKPTSKGKQFRYFLVRKEVWSEAGGCAYSKPYVVKALSEKTAVNRFAEADLKRTMREDYGGSYAPVYRHSVIGEFETQKQPKPR